MRCSRLSLPSDNPLNQVRSLPLYPTELRARTGPWFYAGFRSDGARIPRWKADLPCRSRRESPARLWSANRNRHLSVFGFHDSDRRTSSRGSPFLWDSDGGERIGRSAAASASDLRPRLGTEEETKQTPNKPL